MIITAVCVLFLISVSCPKNKDYYLVTLLSLRFWDTIKRKRRNLVLKTKKWLTSTFELSGAKNQSSLVPRPYSCITHSARADRSFPRPTSLRPVFILTRPPATQASNRCKLSFFNLSSDWFIQITSARQQSPPCAEITRTGALSNHRLCHCYQLLIRCMFTRFERTLLPFN